MPDASSPPQRQAASEERPPTKRSPWFWGLHAAPPDAVNIGLALLPFILLVAVYVTTANVRTRANPQEKLTPTVNKMVKAVHKVALTEDRRTGQYLLWSDTGASLKRIALGMALSALCGLVLGLNMGLLPGIRSLSRAFITFVANIPPLALLPILFIALGVGEVSKVALIFIGTFPLITRDIFLAVRQIPNEMIVKALTLGASQFGVVYRVVLPQILPRLVNTVRLTMGAAWLFLIASEAIAAKEGLGYRIFLVRRYLSMDTIIPYVLWITLLAFTIDWGLRMSVKKLFPWYESSGH
jgi:NitT/TauT family transport system permease protein